MKNKIMQTIVGTFLGLLILLVGAQMSVFGQEYKINGASSVLVGVWQTTAQTRNCTTGDPLGVPFQGLYTFHEGGTLTEDSAGLSPALRSTAHGVWETTSNIFHPTFAFNFLRYNADGTFAGRNTVRASVDVGASGNNYTTTGTFQVFAANGTLITSGCVTTTATRFQ